MKVLMPQLGETVAEGTVAVWRKRVGDRVALDEILADVETDKAAVEIPAGAAGVLSDILVLDGETVDVGTVLAIIDDGTEELIADDEPTLVAEPDPEPEAQPEPVTPAAISSATPRVSRTGAQRLSPVVRRLLGERNLDATALTGTGRDGRITRRDVLAAIEASAAAVTAAATVPPAPQAAPPLRPALGETIPFSQTRQATAAQSVASKATSAHVLQSVEVDFSAVQRARVQAPSLGLISFLAHAACRALREFPNLNASVDGDAFVMHSDINLGVAVNLGAEGVLTPVIASADELTVSGLDSHIGDVTARAKRGQLSPDELAFGTYTVSNYGSFGTLITAPIIWQPQVGVLSMDSVRKRPVVVERPMGDSLAIRPVGIVTQSFDHRAIDGGYSGAFLARVRELIEQTDWSAQL
ncbi:MAG: dihydrolipoamide acetyltransferase family protein [Gammaproteobacteria bacterium]